MKEMDTQDWPSRQRGATSQRLMFTFTEKLLAKFPHSPIHHYTSIYGALLFSVSPVRCTCIIKYGAVRKFFQVWCCAEILSAVINMTSFLTPWSCTLSFTHGTLPLFQLAGLSKFVLGSHCLVPAKHWFPAKLIKTLNLLNLFTIEV